MTQDELIITIRKKQDEYNRLLKEEKYAEAKGYLAEACRLQLSLVSMTNNPDLKKRRFDEAVRLKGVLDAFDGEYAEKEKNVESGKTDEEAENGEEAAKDGENGILTQLEHDDVTFDSVIGLDEAKAAIKRSLRRVKYDKVFRSLSGNPNFGILLYGEPGTGKTMFAKAVATELDIPFFNLNVSDIKDKYVGESEKNVKRAFAQLRKYDAVVLYCDEAEALFGARGSGESSKLDNNILTELIKEIDGFQKNSTHIIIIAATNHPELIDRAAYSRFVIKTRVGLPVYGARLQILKNNIRCLGGDITFEEIARRTENYSGRDLNKLALTCFDTAFEDYLNEHPDTENDGGVADEVPVMRKHVLGALKSIRPDTTREQIEFYDEYERQFGEGDGETESDGADYTDGLNFGGSECDFKPFPPELLDDYKEVYDEKEYAEWVKTSSLAIEDKLSEFGVQVKVKEATRSAVYTRFALSLARGTSVNSVLKHAEDISLALMGARVRFNTEAQGSPCLELEVENKTRSIVGLKGLWEDALKLKKEGYLLFPIGRGGDGGSVILDSKDYPHILAGGCTGSGKSAFINSLVCFLAGAYSPSELRLVLVDTKQVEFCAYESLPHLAGGVICEMPKIVDALYGLVHEMERRYELFRDARARNLEEYNQTAAEKLPSVALIIDEYADVSLMDTGKTAENAIVRLVQKGRAAGICVILATQRVSADVVSGTIKSNFATRAAFAVCSQTDSRIILDAAGANELCGRGDMLLKTPFGTQRVQAPYVSALEARRIIDFIVGK